MGMRSGVKNYKIKKNIPLSFSQICVRRLRILFGFLVYENKIHLVVLSILYCSIPASYFYNYAVLTNYPKIQWLKTIYIYSQVQRSAGCLNLD